VGAVATGRVPTHPSGDQLASWTSYTSLLTGALFVATCAYLSAVYLVGDLSRRGEADLVERFVRRSTASGLVTGLLASATFAALSRTAPHLFAALTGKALPLVAISAASGMAVLPLVWRRRVVGLRPLAGLAVASAVWGWGYSQYPTVLPPSLTLSAASAPRGTLLAELAVLGLGVVLVGPAFALLYWLQQRDVLNEDEGHEMAGKRVSTSAKR